MGGSGKTPFCAALAKGKSQMGLRVGVLVYAVHGVDSKKTSVWEVYDHSNWKHSSDEAVWHARQRNYRVFATRNRWQAWIDLAKTNELDLLISDDGLEDPRLASAEQWLLHWGERGESIQEIFPMGPLRSLRHDHRVHRVIAMNENSRVCWIYKGPENALGEKPKGPIYLVTGIGDPQRLLKDLQSKSIDLQGQHLLADHSTRIPRVAQSYLDRGLDILVTEKDAVKLESELLKNPHVFVLKLHLEFDL